MGGGADGIQLYEVSEVNMQSEMKKEPRLMIVIGVITGIFCVLSAFGGRMRYPYNVVPSSALNSRYFGGISA